MSANERRKQHSFSDPMMPMEFFVVTPPSNETDESAVMSQGELMHDGNATCNNSSCYDGSDDDDEVARFNSLPRADVEARENKLTSSRSCSSIETHCSADDEKNERSLLQLPKYFRRSESREESRSKKSKSLKSDRSRTPQPGRKFLGRTRSTSPLFARPSIGKALSLGDTDGAKFGLARTVRFLSRKTSGPAAAATGEFIWRPAHSTGSTSDSIEPFDMTVAENAVDSPQPGSLNGLEAPITATHAGVLGSSSGLSSIGNGSDVADGSNTPNDAQRHLRQKIHKISEQIKAEQNSRDENVAEYLKLANNADKQQVARIKSVFEKKNQKSKATVAQLQKKLDTYHKRLKEMENSGSKTQGGKYGLKDVGAKLTDLSEGVVGSVKQGLINSSKLIKKFGSVDNISSLKEEYAGSEDLERSNSVGSVANNSTSDSGEMDFPPNRSVTPQTQQPGLADIRSHIDALERQIKRASDLEAQQERLKNEIEQLSIQIKRDIGILTSNLEAGTYRSARIEDQLHDLSEMHHRELGDIKQDLASLEEKLEYHAQERARDIQEALESCQTRISKMEVQQQHQHQQLVTMEGVENATARALVGKLINLLLSVLAVILVFVSTVSGIVMPFIRDRTRAVKTALFVIIIAILYRNWETWTMSLSEFFWSGR